MSEELIQKAKDNAKENFRSGLNCAESVFKAIIDTGILDIPPDMVRLATGFGGGMGLSGNNCGALVGAMLAVGAAHGRRNPMAESEIAKRIDQLYGNPGLYRFFNQIPHQFRDRVGAVDCREITKDYAEWTDKERSRNCGRVVLEAAGLAVEYILKGQTEGYQQPFRENMAKKQ